jgi:argininosuccinate lyase
MMPALTERRESMREAARRGFATATDLADYLVRKGMAFREWHRATRCARSGARTGLAGRAAAR